MKFGTCIPWHFKDVGFTDGRNGIFATPTKFHKLRCNLVRASKCGGASAISNFFRSVFGMGLRYISHKALKLS